ncbi:UNVERIFIED_CONTAM: hypothetical protein GTU68_039621 [Idotea baltica]|nr:hypothetical protein [Idotea baltica]
MYFYLHHYKVKLVQNSSTNLI